MSVLQNIQQIRVQHIDKLAGPDWYPIFKDLHSGMMLDLAGRQKEAGARLERAHGARLQSLHAQGGFHVAQCHGQQRWGVVRARAFGKTLDDAKRRRRPMRPLTGLVWGSRAVAAIVFMSFASNRARARGRAGL